MKVWIDIKNVHEPLFFKSLIKDMPGIDYNITCREFAEITGLLKKYDMAHTVMGSRPEGSMLSRNLGFAQRTLMLALKVPKFDISLSHSSIWSTYASKLRFRKNITFTDNDISHKINKRMFKYVDYLITPKAIPDEILIKDGIKKGAIYHFDGFKEDIYISDYSPDPKFLESLPFTDFVTIRPESLQATYVPEGVKSIVPGLLKKFSKEDINILFLPRYQSDKNYAKEFPKVYMPPEPLNGLDVCHHSKAILTGAGTFSREAAVMGTPAISFYPGEEFLSVDKAMINNGWIKHSRNVNEIVDYVLSSRKREFNIDKSKTVKKEVIKIIEDILNK